MKQTVRLAFIITNIIKIVNIIKLRHTVKSNALPTIDQELCLNAIRRTPVTPRKRKVRNKA